MTEGGSEVVRDLPDKNAETSGGRSARNGRGPATKGTQKLRPDPSFATRVTTPGLGVEDYEAGTRHPDEVEATFDLKASSFRSVADLVEEQRREIEKENALQLMKALKVGTGVLEELCNVAGGIPRDNLITFESKPQRSETSRRLIEKVRTSWHGENRYE